MKTMPNPTRRQRERVVELACRHCGLRWPGDDALTTDDLRNREKPELPICIKAPPSDRWFIDSGINGHMFEPVSGKEADHG